jgi:hypothetical protein
MAEIGQRITLELPGGKWRHYVLTTMSFSQGGGQVDMQLLSLGLMKERYWYETGTDSTVQPYEDRRED